MTPHLADLPLWVAIPVAMFAVLGAALTLTGTVGLATIKGFYDRLHAPALGTSWGTAGIIIAAMILFSAIEGRFIVHAIVIGVFVMITTPVTMMVVGRAALQRDRAEGADPSVQPGHEPGPEPDDTGVGESGTEDAATDGAPANGPL